MAFPVAAGLRHGLVEGRLEIVAEADRSRLAFEVEKVTYWLNWSAIAILSVGASGGILLLLWPLYPVLLTLAPVAAIAAFSAWFLVNARLSNSGPREFLEGLRVEIESSDEDSW